MLLVADRKKTARRTAPRFARAGAGAKFVSDRRQYVPLRRTRILRLVEQDMVDLRVELVEHPGRTRTMEQTARAFDQIVIVE